MALKTGDPCIVWEGCSEDRQAVILKTRKMMDAYRVQFTDTGEINTVPRYLVFPLGTSVKERSYPPTFREINTVVLTLGN